MSAYCRFRWTYLLLTINSPQILNSSQRSRNQIWAHRFQQNLWSKIKPQLGTGQLIHSPSRVTAI